MSKRCETANNVQILVNGSLEFVQLLFYMYNVVTKFSTKTSAIFESGYEKSPMSSADQLTIAHSTVLSVHQSH